MGWGGEEEGIGRGGGRMAQNEDIPDHSQGRLQCRLYEKSDNTSRLNNEVFIGCPCDG